MVAAYWLRVLFNELFIEIFIGFITSHLFNNYIFWVNHSWLAMPWDYDRSTISCFGQLRNSKSIVCLLLYSEAQVG